MYLWIVMFETVYWPSKTGISAKCLYPLSGRPRIFLNIHNFCRTLQILEAFSQRNLVHISGIILYDERTLPKTTQRWLINKSKARVDWLWMLLLNLTSCCQQRSKFCCFFFHKNTIENFTNLAVDECSHLLLYLISLVRPWDCHLVFNFSLQGFDNYNYLEVKKSKKVKRKYKIHSGSYTIQPPTSNAQYEGGAKNFQSRLRELKLKFNLSDNFTELIQPMHIKKTC